MKTSWRCLSSLSSQNFFKTSSRHLDQDEYIRLGHTSSKDVFQTFSRRLDQDEHIHLSQTSLRRLQDLSKTPSKRLAKMSSGHLEDVFKMSHQVKLSLSTRLQEVIKTFSRQIQNVFEKYCENNYLQKDLPRLHFWEIHGQGTNFLRVNFLDIPKLLENFFKNTLWSDTFYK